MGTKVAVGYANNALGRFEKEHVSNYPLQPRIYLRYIDDLFLIWTKGREELDKFITHLNTRTSYFKFTSEISSSTVTFLDTSISIQGKTLVADLYTKPTDSHNYLYYDSAHPQRCKDSIPYSQFLRLKRICTKEEDFTNHCLTLSNFFIKRKYPALLLEEAIHLANTKNRETLLNEKPKNKTDDNKIFLINRYHPHDDYLRKLVHKNWSFLLKYIFKVCYEFFKVIKFIT